MDIIVRGIKLEVTDAIKEYATEKIGRLERYLPFSDEITTTINLKVRDKEHTVEVTMPIRKAILRGEVTTHDLYEAIDLVSEKLERQIIKLKTKQKKHDRHHVILENFVSNEEDESVVDQQVVKRKEIELKPMSEDEAILQMELIGHDFFLYLDSKTNKTSVVYKRRDDHYGIIGEK